MEWKELQTLVNRKIGYGVVQPGESVSGGIPVIKVNNIISGLTDVSKLDTTKPEIAAKYQRTKLNGGELVISVVGTYGKTAIVPKSFAGCNLVRATCLIDIEDESLCEWVKYYIDSPQGQGYINNNLNTTVQATLNVKSLNEMPIPFYSSFYMKKAVSILSSLDAKIETNNKINAQLEEMAQAIFKSWLSKCDKEVTIGDLSINVTDYTKCDAEQVVLVNSSDVTEGHFDHHNYSENKNLKGHFKKRFLKGDILYSQVRPRNRHWAYCDFDSEDYLASTQLMVIRNKEDLLPSILLYQYIISDDVWMEFTLKTETRSGTFPQGNYEEISTIKVPWGADVEDVSRVLDIIYKRISNSYKESLRLSQLRDTLLPKLMSGEIDLDEIEKLNLREICVGLLEEIKVCNIEDDTLFTRFPNGYCSKASLWLYDVLKSKGYKNIEFRSRAPFLPYRDGNHVWLHCGEYNIDITASQFNKFGENFPEVIISKDGENELYDIYDESNGRYYYAIEYIPNTGGFETMLKEINLLYKKLGLKFSVFEKNS